MIWLSAALAAPIDVDVMEILTESEARSGYDDATLAARRDHALRLLETYGITDDQRERARLLYCDYAVRHAAAYGGFASGPSREHCPDDPNGSNRRREIAQELPGFLAYRDALDLAKQLEPEAALAALPSTRKHADATTPAAVLDEAIDGLRDKMDDWNRHNRLQGPFHDTEVARLGVEMGLLLWDVDRDIAGPRLTAATRRLSPERALHVGRAHSVLGQHQQALPAYEMALDLDGEDRDQVLIRLGDTHQALGHHAKACMAWSQVPAL